MSFLVGMSILWNCVLDDIFVMVLKVGRIVLWRIRCIVALGMDFNRLGRYDLPPFRYGVWHMFAIDIGAFSGALLSFSIGL